MNDSSLDKPDKKAIVIIASACFLAEIIRVNLFLGLGSLIYFFMGVHDYRLYCNGGISCPPEVWMTPVISSVMLPYHFIMVASGYYITRKATSINMIALGAILFYPFVSGLLIELSNAILFHRYPWSFFAYADRTRPISIAFFGNVFNFKLTFFVIHLALKLLFTYWAYLIVFRIWTPTIRKIIFTYGLIACALSWVFWYLWLGPLIY